MPRITTVLVDGARLRELRTEAGLDRRELAELAKCSESHVRNVENGHRPRLSDVKAARVARVLDERLPRSIAVEAFTAPGDVPRPPAPRGSSGAVPAGEQLEQAS